MMVGLNCKQGSGVDMTFREKIADWISGGALSLYGAKMQDEMRKDKFLLLGSEVSRLNAMGALEKISAMETPKAAHAAKKMAAVANEALGKTDDPVKVAP